MRKLVPTILLLAAGCMADTTVTLQATGLPSTVYATYYDGYTIATINGVPGVPIICDDQAHDTNVPSPTMIYDFSTINTASSTITNARFVPGNSGDSFAGETQTQLYEEAAILVFDFAAALPGLSAEQIGQYQFALWKLMDGAVTLPSGAKAGQFTSSIDTNSTIATTDNNAVTNILNTVNSQFNSSNSNQIAKNNIAYNELAIYTPSAQYASNQEFLGLRTVPEPATLGLASLLLFGMGFIAWRRRGAKASA